ncbi:S1 family peptidase [Streptomyces sp. I05A-00742]|uniref:S1 family peptidase n=1 Tax=Streptomyces sp. I05A-00742 TaxID=2732853 RepID=UPI002017D5B7|nr:S1 family peptidase [Streptomyces sp. I05A-00742]
MKTFRLTVRGAPAGAVALAVVLAVVVLVPRAQASPASPAAEGGRATAGSSRGADASARLAGARRALDRRVAIPGTAWVTDPGTRRVVVTADPTVTGARLARLNEVAARLGDAVTVRRSTTRLTRFLAGGDGIRGGSVRCTLGFNVVKDGRPAFLTAGHCGKAVAEWSGTGGGPRAAVTETSVFPGHDYALARYTDGAARRSEVALRGGGTRAITRAGDAYLGEAVQRGGSTTGVHAGRVTGLDATVNYAEGRVTGLIETDVCAEPGDSGGPLFDGGTALGITSGGSGDCASGGKTYYQPVPRALRALGAGIG